MSFSNILKLNEFLKNGQRSQQWQLIFGVNYNWRQQTWQPNGKQPKKITNPINTCIRIYKHIT